MSVPDVRVWALNDAPVRGEGDFVLYWMIAYRRITWNFGLQRAVEWARDLKKPLVVFEALGCDYRWASDRLHRFVLDGMAENARRLGCQAKTADELAKGLGGITELALEELDGLPLRFIPVVLLQRST